MSEPEGVVNSTRSSKNAIMEPAESKNAASKGKSDHWQDEAEKMLMERIDVDPEYDAAKLQTPEAKASLATLIRVSGNVFQKKYKFTTSGIHSFPLIMLCLNQVDDDVINAAYKACPVAFVDLVSYIQHPSPLSNQHDECHDSEPELAAGNVRQQTKSPCFNGAVLALIKRLVSTFPNCLQLQDDEHDYSALHVAVANDAPLPLIQLICETYPGATKVPTSSGQLAIHLACSNDICRNDVICLFVDKDPDSLKQTNDKGQTPLHLASTFADARAIEFLVSSSPEALQIKSLEPMCTTPFLAMCCRQSSSMETLQHVVESHPDVLLDKSLEDSSSPLHLAVCHNQPCEMIQFLIDKMGAHKALTEINKLGYTPLQLACQNRTVHSSVSNLVLEAEPAALYLAKDEHKEPFVLACQHGHVDTARCIVAKFPQVLGRKCFRNCWSLLHMGAYLGWCLDIIKLLVENMGVDGLMENGGGSNCTPLHWAVRRRREGQQVPIEVIDFLMEACPESITIADSRGNLPIDVDMIQQVYKSKRKAKRARKIS